MPDRSEPCSSGFIVSIGHATIGAMVYMVINVMSIQSNMLAPHVVILYSIDGY